MATKKIREAMRRSFKKSDLFTNKKTSKNEKKSQVNKIFLLNNKKEKKNARPQTKTHPTSHHHHRQTLNEKQTVPTVNPQKAYSNNNNTKTEPRAIKVE